VIGNDRKVSAVDRKVSDGAKLASQPEPGSSLYDPLSFEVRQDPYPAYRRLRESAPVYFCAERGVWVLSRYDDVRAALRDWQTFTSAQGLEIGEFVGFFGKGDFVQLDPPEHDVLRRVLAPRFANRAMAGYEPAIIAIAEQLVADLPAPGVVDLADTFTQRLPLLATCQMLGIPQSDVPWLVAGFTEMMRRPAGESTIPDRVRQLRAELGGYFADQVRGRIDGDGASDLLGDIAGAVRDGTMPPEYVPGMCLMLMDAGMETTAGLLGTIVHLIATGAASASDMLDADGGLTNSAVDEFLRYDSPIQWLSRVTTADVTVRGQTISKGSRVLLLYASANRDAEAFPDPDRLDLNRNGARHLAFGDGIHFCLGMPLAKLEARVGMRALLRRHPQFTLSGEAVRFPGLVSRAFHHIPVRLDAPASVG